MFERLSSTAIEYFWFYCNMAVDWWSSIGPDEYVLVLCCSFVFGFLMLRNNRSRPV